MSLIAQFFDSVHSRPDESANTIESDEECTEYGKIKNFNFEIGYEWDDRNVCIFLHSYRETMREFSDYNKKNVYFWMAVAERGLASGGSQECFSSFNCCMELAERLKEFVEKYEMDLRGVVVFENLKKDVFDLLPYFPSLEYELIENRKSRNVQAVYNPTAISKPETLELILQVCHRHRNRFGRFGNTYFSIFSDISNEVTAICGTKTNVKPILEKLKQDIIQIVRIKLDVAERARLFSELTESFTVFDHIEPRDITKEDYTKRKINRARKTSKNDSTVRRNNSTESRENRRSVTKRSRGSKVKRTQRNFSPGNRSDGSVSSGRREPQADRYESAAIAQPFRSHRLPRANESGTPGSRSVVPRGRSQATAHYGEIENDMAREMVNKYEDLEMKKMNVVQKMHAEVVNNMKKSNDQLKLILKNQKGAETVEFKKN